MDACDILLEKYEIANNKINELIFCKVINQFIKKTNLEFYFGDLEEYNQKFRAIRDGFIYKTSDLKYVDIFFDLLKENKYNMVQEIKDAILLLGILENPNKNNEHITKVLNSPYIQDISFNGKNKFEIYSDEFGKFNFELASSYFKNDFFVRNYINNYVLYNYCHENSYFLSKACNNYYSITSLCKNYFYGDYYHSYNYNRDENLIIDLCYNLVIDKEQYYKLFYPKELSIILGSDVDRELSLVENKTEQRKEIFNLLKIALFKQYLKSIGYDGDLENAPSSSKKIKKN